MKILEKLHCGLDLQFEEATTMFNDILSGSVEESLIEAILIALAEKGEAKTEIAASAAAMKSHAIPVNHSHDLLLDIVGTGGDGAHSFNISTAAAIVSSIYVPVAKHGNRAVSSKSGSADVLEALGVPIDLESEEASRHLAEKHFAFLFAQKYHPAMKAVAPVRKRLARRTIFNLLGPLCNPARPNYMLIGLFRHDFMEKYMGAIEYLDIPNVIVVSSRDGLDEVSISDKTFCSIKRGSSIKTFDFDPKEFDIYADKESMRGYEPKDNARIMQEVFQGKSHEHLVDVIAINAAFALMLTEVEPDLRKAFLLARETVRTGKAYDRLMELAS